MELYKEILIQVLSKQDMQILFPNLNIDTTKIVESECYKALQKIKAVIEDDSLEDEECFMRVEKIICALEEIGSDGGLRHDF